jgi:hypothetical protein
MDYLQMTAPCGLDCFNCPMYLANENDELRATISQKHGIPIEQASCDGCRNEGGKIVFLCMTEPCDVYKCIKRKGIKICSECTDFPCDHLIKKMGLESWAKDKAKSVKETYFKGTWKI